MNSILPLAILVGFTVSAMAETPVAAKPEPKLIATITTGINVDGQSFKVGESFEVEALDKIAATATTSRNGRKYRLPIRVLTLQELPENDNPAPELATPSTDAVVVVKAQYGPPGGRQANVVNRVRTLVTKTPRGQSPSILVSGELQGAAANPTIKSDIRVSGTVSSSGAANFSGTVTTPVPSVLTVNYTVNGVARVAQGKDGSTVILK